MAKGGQFERDICRRLTRWWTGDPDHDVLFWRTSQSGGRATVRGKRGQKSTAAHCGDITALDERGAPLTRLITWELKTGYSTATIHAAVDHPPGTLVPKKANYHNWIVQAVVAARHAETPYWGIIHHRPKRTTLITIPTTLFDALGCTPRTVDPPILRATIEVRIGLDYRIVDLTTVHLDAFLDGVTPTEIRRLYGVMTKCPPASGSGAPCVGKPDR